MQERSRSFRLVPTICLGIALSACHSARLEARSADHTVPVLSPGQLFQIALFHANHGDLLRAEQYLSTARAEGYDEPEVVYWLVRVCVSAGRYRSALRHAEEHLRAHPTNWRLRFVVASLYEALEDLARARIELENIVRAEPSRALPRYSLAKLYMREGATPQGAVAHLEAYLQLEPNGRHAAEVEVMLGQARMLDTSISRPELLRVEELGQ